MTPPLPPICDFHGYRVVVAGGSKGIGRSIALAFAEAGASVSVCARGEAALDEVRHAIAACGATAHTRRCDLAEAAAIKSYVEEAAEVLGGIDVLVNNASGYGFTDDDAGWLAGFQVDLMAAVRASHAALPHLKTSTHASILHTSSIAVPSSPWRRTNAICASVNFDLFMALPRPAARITLAAKLEFSSNERSENREAPHTSSKRS